jgi:hypothetical protein
MAMSRCSAGETLPTTTSMMTTTIGSAAVNKQVGQSTGRWPVDRYPILTLVSDMMYRYISQLFTADIIYQGENP